MDNFSGLPMYYDLSSPLKVFNVILTRITQVLFKLIFLIFLDTCTKKKLDNSLLYTK